MGMVELALWYIYFYLIYCFMHSWVKNFEICGDVMISSAYDDTIRFWNLRDTGNQVYESLCNICMHVCLYVCLSLAIFLVDTHIRLILIDLIQISWIPACVCSCIFMHVYAHVYVCVDILFLYSCIYVCNHLSSYCLHIVRNQDSTSISLCIL
jgi:hypothetical protein